MNTFRKFGLSVMAVLATLSLSSCSDDDDKDENGGGSGNITATLDGASLGLSTVYWYIDSESSTSSTSNNIMAIEFYSYDPTNLKSFPNSISYLSVNYEIPATQTSIESATIESGDYHIYVAKDVTMNSEGWQGETDYRATTNSPLVITRDGNNITVSVANAEISDWDTSKTLKLSYSGTIPMLPEQFQD